MSRTSGEIFTSLSKIRVSTKIQKQAGIRLFPCNTQWKKKKKAKDKSLFLLFSDR